MNVRDSIDLDQSCLDQCFCMLCKTTHESCVLVYRMLLCLIFECSNEGKKTCSKQQGTDCEWNVVTELQNRD